MTEETKQQIVGDLAIHRVLQMLEA